MAESATRRAHRKAMEKRGKKSGTYGGKRSYRADGEGGGLGGLAAAAAAEKKRRARIAAERAATEDKKAKEDAAEKARALAKSK